MKINVGDFRVHAGDEVDLQKWPTSITSVCKSKKAYQSQGNQLAIETTHA